MGFKSFTRAAGSGVCLHSWITRGLPEARTDRTAGSACEEAAQT